MSVPAPADGNGRGGATREPGRTLASLTLFGVSRAGVKVILALAAVGVYALAFIPPERFQETGVVELIAIPVLVSAWLFGFWVGLLAAMLSLPITATLLTLVGQPGWTLLSQPETLQGSVLILVLGAVLGGLRDLSAQMQEEFAIRKDAEVARDESEERYRIVAEGASDAIFTLDGGARILFANPAAIAIFGHSEDALVGKPFTILLPEDERSINRARLTQYFDDLVEGGVPTTLQVVGLSSRGLRIDLEISFGHQKIGDRGFFTAIVRDVTDRKNVETMLQEAKEEAERANRAKSDFLSRMSHELRTPLNAILGFGQLLELEELPSEEQRESVGHIMKAGSHLLALVDEVLDISRIEAGRLAMTIESVDVGAVLDEAWDLVRPRATQRRVERAGPAGSCSRYCQADRQRLKQVVLNLVSNAVKYTPEGSVVELACEESRPGFLRILVKDNGRGIPEEMQDRLFKPFERLGAERTGIEGTGIGLALSKGLVEAMDGTIGLDTTQGAGSTFWVELPIDAADHADGGSRARAGDEPEHTHTILLIEDTPSTPEPVKGMVSRNPRYRLMTAAIQGGLGIELAGDHRPDLIILDLHDPDMPGEEVLQRLRTDPASADIPVIVIPAASGEAVRQALLAAGADACLFQPLELEGLMRVIEELLAEGTGSVRA